MRIVDLSAPIVPSPDGAPEPLATRIEYSDHAAGAAQISELFGVGPELPSSYDYFNKTSSGANLLTINGGHALDLVEAVLGPIIEIDARTEISGPLSN